MKISVNAPEIDNVVILPLFLNDDNELNLDGIETGLKTLITTDLAILSDPGNCKKYFFTNKECIVITAGKETSETVRLFIFNALKQAHFNNCKNITIDFSRSAVNLANDQILEVASEALFITNYTYESLKSNKKKTSIDSINIKLKENIASANNIIAESENIGKSLNIVRDLVNGPANIITINYMEETASIIAKEKNLLMKVYDESELKSLGMNLILGVGSGSSQNPRLLELKYNQKPGLFNLTIVGKGVVFDAGGLDIKSPDNMLGMKMDMAGAATALGIINLAATMNLDVSLTVLIPLVENFISSESYRPGDVIKSYSGKTVEINNTDAEGRLILADALSFAVSKSPDLIIDIATLTGAAIIALGSKITAGFFTDTASRDELLSASAEKGENIWELPLNNEYRDYLKSKIADLSNIGNPPREAGSIIAALFLKEFVGNTKWIHLDIAGTAFAERDWKYYPQGATGYTLRTIYEFLKRKQVK